MKKLWIVYEVHLLTAESFVFWLLKDETWMERMKEMGLVEEVEELKQKLSELEKLEQKLLELLEARSGELDKDEYKREVRRIWKEIRRIQREIRRVVGEAAARQKMQEKILQELSRLGYEEKWERIERDEEKWERIRQLVHERIKGLDPAKLKIYVDSMRNDADVEELKEEIKEGLFPKVYKDLLELGAQFRPTEDEEVFNLCDEIEEELENLREECEKRCKEAELLGRLWSITFPFFKPCIIARNIAIAMRINEDLKEGETGILFIGAAHDGIERFISPSIQCEVIFKADEWVI